MSDRRGQLMIVAAQPEHAFSIYKTLLKALEQAGTKYPPPDMPYCIQALLDLIAQDLVGVAVVRKWGEDRVVGVVALDFQRWPWCHPQNQAAVHLYNQHFWVEPEYRKGGTAAKLLDFAMRVADSRCMVLKLIFSNVMGEASAARDRFARIKGFVYTGGDFIRTPRPIV